jgi:hypothetical protein
VSASDDILSFEEQLRRLVLAAVSAAEQTEPGVVPMAYVLGYVMGGARFTDEERAALHERIYNAPQQDSRTTPKES